MPSDALRVLQASTTRTAAFNGAFIDIGRGGQNTDLVFRVKITAANASGATGTAVFRIADSADGTNPITFFSPTEGTVTLPVSPAAFNNYIYFRVRTPRRYIRLELQTITGTSATVTYFAEQTTTDPNLS